LLRYDDGGRGENGAELAGGERVQGAKAAFEFDRSQAAQAKEGAQKIFGGRFSLLGVAFNAAGNEIAVGIAASTGSRDDVVEHSPTSDETPQAIKAMAALARMNGLTPAADLQEVQLLEVAAAWPPGDARGHCALVRCGVHLVRQQDFDQVTSLAAVHHAQGALGSEAAHGVASGPVRKANATGEPDDRKTELALAFEAAMPQEMGVDRSLGKIEAQAGHENIFELFPDEFSVGFFVFHGLGSKEELTVHSKGERLKPGGASPAPMFCWSMITNLS